MSEADVKPVEVTSVVALQDAARAFYREIKGIVGTVAIRGRRPAIGWIGVLFLAGIGAAIVTAFFRAALTGAPVPDMTAGLGGIALAIIPTLFDQWSRHQEVKGARAGSEAGVGMGPGAAVGA